MSNDLEHPGFRVAIGARPDLDAANRLHRAIARADCVATLTGPVEAGIPPATGLDVSSGDACRALTDFRALSQLDVAFIRDPAGSLDLDALADANGRADAPFFVEAELSDGHDTLGRLVRASDHNFEDRLEAAADRNQPFAISVDDASPETLDDIRASLKASGARPAWLVIDATCVLGTVEARDILVEEHGFSSELLHKASTAHGTPPGSFDSISDLIHSVRQRISPERSRASSSGSSDDRFSSETITDSHDHSNAASAARTNAMNQSDTTNGAYDGQKDVAIVGIGAKMPQALSADAFWDNIKNGVYAIRETPKDRWDPELYYDPDPQAPDKTYSKIGGWITDFEFDRKYYRIPPFTVQSMDESQLLAMETTREALEDAGYLDDDDFDGERCATILGNTLGGDLRDWTNLRIQYPEFEMTARRLLNSEFSGKLSQREINEFLDTLEKEFKGRFNSIDEDSMPGELPNVISGRVANAFDLRGPNFVTDAACASSLASVEQAVRGLRMHQFDTAVTGGVDRFMGPSAFVKFCKIGALSPDGSRPFDEGANGFVMGEGCGVLVLKRLEDAVDNNDDIVAVIRGCGSASDGAGKGITAPNPRGQKLAVKRAYEDAGYGPRSISLYEAHGTSTPIGDPTEFRSTHDVVSEDSGPAASNSIAMGSVKSMIGHLKAGAGAASLIKVSSALRDQLLPPTLNVETPHPELEIDDTCFHIQQTTDEWSVNEDAPRRAGVSAFGFGGTDFHMTLEEWDPNRWSDGYTRQSFSSTNSDTSSSDTSSARPGVRDDSTSAKSDDSQPLAENQARRDGDTGTADSPPVEQPPREEIIERMTDVLCEQTGYDPAEIETDFELEADLGVDTVKQAEILAEVREEYGLAKDEDFRFSDYPTLERLADYVEERFEAGAYATGDSDDDTATAGDDAPAETQAKTDDSQTDAENQAPRNADSDAHTDSDATTNESVSAERNVAAKTAERPSRDEIIERMTEVLCEQTGYDPAEIETDFELEADLGVDTVKQAEILAEVREEYGLAKDEDFRFSDYPTLERLADYVEERFDAGAYATGDSDDATAAAGDDASADTPGKTGDSQTDAENRGRRDDIDLTQGLIAFTGDTDDQVAETFRSFKSSYETDGLEATRAHRIDLEEHSHREDIAIPDGDVRLALAYGSVEELEKQLDRTAGAFGPDGTSWRILQNQGVYYADDIADGRIAMQFPGQGTQYLGMLSDLKERYSVVQEIFDRADDVMRPVINEDLSNVIDPEEWTDEAETKLRQTEYTQPAVLTADIALLKLLEEFGIEPDVVSGHSLGEYGALVAAGVMSFEDALRTVARRGTAMAEATPLNGDCGLMASIPAGPEEVQKRLQEIDGYVVCANKNCPKQTIIAGLTEPVETAVEMFEDDGYMVQYLNVSHAFHTKVVAEGSKPLREHLESMDIKPPQIPVLTNVTGGYHPTDPDEIRDLMAEQVASPVEWQTQVRRMYEDGARIFIEVGPKSALTTFISSILRGEEGVISTKTNHPKDGGVPSLLRAIGQLWAEGIWTDRRRVADAYDGPSLGTSEPVGESEASPSQRPDSDAADIPPVEEPPREEIIERMTEVLCEQTGYDPAEIETDFELEADLGVDTVKQAEILAEVREEYGLAKDEDFRFSDYPTLERLADYVEERFEAGAYATGDSDDGTAAAADDAPADTQAKTDDSQTDAENQARRDGDTGTPDNPPVERPPREEIIERMTEVLCEQTGYDPAEIETDFELEADLGVDTVKQAEILAEVREEYGLAKDEDFRFSDYPTLERLADYVEERFEAGAYATGDSDDDAAAAADDASADTQAKTDDSQTDAENQARRDVDGGPDPDDLGTERTVTTDETPEGKRDIHRHDISADVVISGGSLGLPGTDEVFADDAVEQLLDGSNFIGNLDREDRERIVSKQITRLRKHEGGGGELEEVNDPDEVVKLAARAGSFDFDDWGIPNRLADALDHTSQLAFAAGLEALRDAGLPLVPKYRKTQSGKKLTEGWKLPDKIGDETGIIFASAFAGQDAFADELEAYYTDEDYEFNHRLLLRMLGMANARFAEYVGARGPNTKINNACASTTTAIGMAHDWIARNRCKRVVILSADDATSDTLMEWVGSGFLATGAATTESDVEDAALPFDRRRNGMIVGMGAVSLVVEEDGLPERRGLEPLADVMSTHFVNSGHHPTRLDVDHIAGEVDKLLSRTESDFDLDRHDIAEKTVFVSHETYTPARGGSADAEIESIRRNFGEDAERMVIANTKGFTGHAQGASIEEMLAVKALQHRRIPPIANFEEPDPNLGNLRLSEGGDYDVDYALRLAAGFGSQLALVMYRFRARTEDRLFDPQRQTEWLKSVTDMSSPELHVEDRTLRVKEGQPDDHPTPPNGPGSGASTETESSDDSGESESADQTTVETPAPVSADSTASHEIEASDIAPDYLDSEVDAEKQHRFRTEAVLVEADTSAAYDPIELKNRLEGRRIVILAGPMLVTNLMRRAAERCGAEVLVIEDSSRRNPLESDETVCNLRNEDAILEHFEEFGPVDGIINLLGFGREDYSPEDVQSVARQTFHVARAWRSHIGDNPDDRHFMTTVTGMGGRLGFDRATSPLPVCGAVCGLTKGLAREWPDAHVRVVDVARDGLYPDLCQQILAETFSDVASLEVGLLGGVRYLPVAVDSSEIMGHGAGKSVAPDSDSVVLITGGAKGITSRIAMDLAKRFGCKLALVGRTELTYEDPLSIDMDEAKEEAKRRIEDRGERVTPVRVRDELYPLKSQRTIHENMKAMESLGADVSYFSCDVSDRELVAQLISDVREHFGRIDGVIHAAGVEDSKLIHDKDSAAFDKVFNAKAVGGLHLWNEIADWSPKFFVTFSSVVARFGNAGQADYAGANEVLNKLVAHINATSEVHALSIDWTAWEDVGMAAGGSVETILRRNGVEFLPPAIGAPILGNALEMGLSGECLVAAELGKLSEGFDLRRERLMDASVDETPSKPAFQGKTVEDASEEGRLVVERVFDSERDRFLNDHVYEGQPVLPGVMGVEMMVQIAEQLTGEAASSVRDVEFERAVKLHHGDPVRVIVTAERRSDGNVEVTLSSERDVKTGRTINRDHFSATVSFEDLEGEEPAPMELDDTRPFDAGFDRPDIYRRFFHTGSFQVIESIAHLNDDTVVGYGRKPTDRAFSDKVSGHLVTDPMVREMGFQTAGIWGMIYNQHSYLPYAIGTTTQYDEARPGETVCIRAKRRNDVEPPSPEVSVISFDIEVRGDDGRLLQTLEDCQMVGHRKLAEDECFPAPDSRRMTLRRMSRPEADALLADRGLEPDEVLTRDEQRDWKRLRSERRRGEWLAARIAAKDLACRYVLEFQGVRPDLEQIEVAKDDNGAPHFQWVGSPPAELSDVVLPNVTVTHAEGVAIAAIAAPGTPCRVGVDLEAVEDRSDSFADNYFTEKERQLDLMAGDDLADTSSTLTAFWSVKEAVSKALGLGLKLALGEIIIEEIRPSEGYSVAVVSLNGKAREEAKRLNAGDLEVHIKLDGGFALASARLELQERRGQTPGTDDQTQKTTTADTDTADKSESGNGHEPAVQTDGPQPRHGEFAAVAALLKHKGLLDAERSPAEQASDDRDTSDRSLPSWRS